MSTRRDQPADLCQESDRWPVDKQLPQWDKKGAVPALITAHHVWLRSSAISYVTIKSRVSPFSVLALVRISIFGTGFKAGLVIILSSCCPDIVL